MVKYRIDMSELLPWHHMPAQDVLLALGSSGQGLQASAAAQRLLEFGPNQVSVARPVSVPSLVFRQVKSPLMLVLVLALLLSVGLGKLADAVLTFGVIALNTLMGFIQEYQADRALHALKTYLPVQALVRRSGQVVTVLAQDIVPGDILLLSAGNKITADARLLSASNFSSNEAALTGESSEVNKSATPNPLDVQVAERASMLFAGSSVVSGRAEAVVVATSQQTEFGKITAMLATTPNPITPLQQQLKRLSVWLVGVMLSASAFVFILGAVRGIAFTEMLSISAALAVAAVPEGLLVGVTVILTVGMRRMLKRRALVHSLLAAETLGSVNILCVDKTGTLTTGEMSVAELRVGTALVDGARLHNKNRDLLFDLLVLNSAQVEVRLGAQSKVLGSATDTSLRRYLDTFESDLVKTPYQILEEIPFSAAQQCSAKLVRVNGSKRALVLGAPEVVLSRCDLDDHNLRAYHALVTDMTKRGLRVLLLAEKTLLTPGVFELNKLTDLKPLGMVGLRDPLRPLARETIAQATLAGIRTVMLTGDHPMTASAIAGELGLPTQPHNVMRGDELDKLTDQDLLERLRGVSVFARVLPEQKLRLVRLFQSLGYAVAMTGDGVNDAPALRAAEIGVAVGSGTEVAKDTADMVILDNDVSSLVEAIREGRIIFDNLRKLVAYLLTFSLSEIVLIAGILVLGLPVPFAALHILWINLITDGLPSVALAFEPGESGLMHQAPRRSNEPIITPGMRRLMMFTGTIAVMGLLLLYLPVYNAGYSLEVIRAGLFLALGLDSLLAIYPLRTLRQPFWQVRPFRNPYLSGAVGLGLGLLILPLATPVLQEIFSFGNLSLLDVIVITSIALVKILLIELGKIWFLADTRRYETVLVS